MIAWYWVLVIIITTNFLSVFFYEIIPFYDIWEKILCILAFPFIWIGYFPWTFFKNFIHPVNQINFEKAVEVETNKRAIHKLSKNIYLWHDSKAKKLQHHWFLVRVKNK